MSLLAIISPIGGFCFAEPQAMKPGGCIIEVPFAMDVSVVVGGTTHFNLVKGLFVQCSDHPTYRALRKPTAKCAVCKMMYDRRRR